MNLFFIECCYFHIKNSLKTFQNIVYALIHAQQLLIISERRRETRREASRRSTQRASCHSHMRKENNIITRERLILAMWFMEQKVILFQCRTDIRDEPARPEPARP